MQQALNTNPQMSEAILDGAAIYTAPANSGQVVLGRTLTSLLDEACECNPHPKALNQLMVDAWQPLSTLDFRRRAEHLALGLLELGLSRSDRVAFFTHSDVSFVLGDMACLYAGLVDVPIYLTHAPSAIKHIVNESEAKVLIVSDEALFEAISPMFAEMPCLQAIVMWGQAKSKPTLPKGLVFFTFDELEQKGETVNATQPERLPELKHLIQPKDLATILYTSGTTGMPKGVMLTHENISSNVISAITGLSGLQRGQAETAISFLPLTHIFARTLQYALMWYGISIYYSDPENLRDHLKEVKPTFFAAVPRVIEKSYERILATGASLTGVKKTLFDWALELAQHYDVEKEAAGLYGIQLKLADRLVLSKWREALGGRIKTILIGGAALRPDLVNIFGAARIQLIQGYGLTETSPVITYNRPTMNKPGTVGPVLAGVEVKIASDGEILTRGPHVMQGYYKDAETTAKALQDGWFHTGDMGEFTTDGYLKITGRIKNLFKLSTGKYVMPQPIEDRLEGELLISNALIIGEGEKYCAALVFVNQDALGEKTLVESQETFRQLISKANGDLPPWSCVKRAILIPEELSIQNGMLTPKLSVKRKLVLEHYQAHITTLYGYSQHDLDNALIVEI